VSTNKQPTSKVIVGLLNVLFILIIMFTTCIYDLNEPDVVTCDNRSLYILM